MDSVEAIARVSEPADRDATNAPAAAGWLAHPERLDGHQPTQAELWAAEPQFTGIDEFGTTWKDGQPCPPAQ